VKDEDRYGRQLLILCAREDERLNRQAALKKRAPLWKRWAIGLLVLNEVRGVIMTAPAWIALWHWIGHRWTVSL